MVKSVGILMTALLIVGATFTAGDTPDEFAWPEITREHRPWTRWWWHASAVDRDNLRRELEAMAGAGFGGVEITPIYGVRGQENRSVSYLSPQWLELLLHAAEQARRLDLGLDMPPGTGWRLGGPFVTLDTANTRLHIETGSARAGETWRHAAHDGRRIEAVLARSPQGETVAVPPPGEGAGSWEWRPPAGSWTLFILETGWSREMVKRPAPGGEGYSIDVYSRRAVTAFLEAYRERIRSLPRGTVRSFFHDSFEYAGDGSPDLLEEFRRRRGYDLGRRLAALAGTSPDDAVARVKSDYRETLSDMLRDNLVTPLAEWAHRSGGLSRNQAHGSPGNLLDLYAASDIPEAEIFGPLGSADNDPLISKFASSAAHAAGRRLCSAETATWLGEHFTVTLDTLKRAVDQLFVSGVNHVIFHGTAYSPEDASWPGWLFYASTQLNSRNAIWRDLPELNRYISRCQSILQSGEPDGDVLLYWPVYDNWHDPSGMRMSFAVHRPVWFYSRPVSGVARMLWDEGYGFDYVSDRLLMEARSVEGSIQAPGGAYRALVVPRTDRMPVETLRKIIELAHSGATVIFQDRLPPDVPGMQGLEDRRRQLEGLKDGLAFEEGSLTAGAGQARPGTGRIMTGPSVASMLRVAAVPRESMVDHRGLRFLRRKHAQGHHYFVSHAGESALEVWVTLAMPAASVVIMDPASGATGLARTRRTPEGKVEVYLQLSPGESILLRTFDREIQGTPWAYLSPRGGGFEVAGNWQVRFIAGGPVLPAPFETPRLDSWTDLGDEEARRFAGTARYTIRFDLPAPAARHVLDLGSVAESARVRVNGRDVAVLYSRPFRVAIGDLREKGNLLEIEVTNLSANRIRELDLRAVPWRIFHDINFVNIDYRPFDASSWPVRASGLLGPVRLEPLE